MPKKMFEVGGTSYDGSIVFTEVTDNKSTPPAETAKLEVDYEEDPINALITETVQGVFEQKGNLDDAFIQGLFKYTSEAERQNILKLLEFLRLAKNGQLTVDQMESFQAFHTSLFQNSADGDTVRAQIRPIYDALIGAVYANDMTGSVDDGAAA